MRLSELLRDLDVVDVRGDVHREIARVSRDTRDVDGGALFVAIRGTKVDGHDLVAGLRDVGAVVVERDAQAPEGVPVVRVRDSKRALAYAAAALNGHPARTVKVVGVTGTKGKTTTTTLIEGALVAAGRHCGRIGTTGASLDLRPIPSDLTTPEAPQLQALLAEMRDGGAEAVAMEVSSIGLVQRRVDAIPFHFAVFTNLGRDHLDFHGTVEAYRDAKAELFKSHLRAPGGLPRAALNADDPESAHMGAPADAWTYGFAPTADVRIERFAMTGDGIRFSLATPLGTAELTSVLVGRHNAHNLAAAACACLGLGLSVDETAAGLGTVKGVPGRLETVPNDRGIVVAVDYAHTEESLAAVLTALRDVTKGRLFCVFGCGGDRDPGKRPRMGAVVARLADVPVVTSDNPRSEDPRSIVDAVLRGMDRVGHVDVDRRQAIAWALGEAREGDVVLIAGKGHETYQEVQGVKHPFDDREVASELLGRSS